MTIATSPQTWTDQDWMALPREGHRYELVDGQVVDLGHVGMEHGYLACVLVAALMNWVRSRRLGAVCDSSTAFTLGNGNRRSPDIAFIDRSRLQGLSRPPRGYFEGAPDLVVEILSPGNTVDEMHQKIVEYFAHGTRLLWKIDPNERCILVYHGPEPDRLLRVGDLLEGEDVVSGFAFPVAELFEPWDF